MVRRVNDGAILPWKVHEATLPAITRCKIVKMGTSLDGHYVCFLH